MRRPVLLLLALAALLGTSSAAGPSTEEKKRAIRMKSTPKLKEILADLGIEFDAAIGKEELRELVLQKDALTKWEEKHPDQKKVRAYCLPLSHRTCTCMCIHTHACTAGAQQGSRRRRRRWQCHGDGRHVLYDDGQGQGRPAEQGGGGQTCRDDGGDARWPTGHPSLDLALALALALTRSP